MRVIETGEWQAKCEGRGETQTINMRLVGDLPVGSWVLVHMGSAVRELEPEEAAQIGEALNALEAAMKGEPLDGFFTDLKRS